MAVPKGNFLALILLIASISPLNFYSAPVSAAGSCCPSPLYPGSRQVVATCSVTDLTNTSNTFWNGDSIANCPGDLLTLSHAIAHAGLTASDSCVGTTFEASIVSVEGSVFTSQLSLIPTSSNNGERVFCASPAPSSVIQECTLNVPSADVTGVIEQHGLSEVFLNVTLMDGSGSACVDEYFTIFNGSRVNSNNPRVGPFPVNLCSTSEISGLIVGTSRNGVDGPTTTVSVFTADTTNLYSNLAVSHSYDVSGVTLDLSWTVVDETVMSESEVMMSCSCESCSSSCVDSSEISDSATSHRLQLSYNEFSLGRVSVSVSFQSGSCSNVETRVYEVTNFGMATVSPDEETVIFSFNNSLLASGVNVTRIRRSCEDGSQEMFWNYPLTNVSLNVINNCPNGSYTFQALTSGNMTVGFPIPVEYTSPTAMVNFSEPQGSSLSVIIISVVVVVIVLVSGALLAVILGVVCGISHNQKKTVPSQQEAVYEDIADPSPSTAHNVAYGRVSGGVRSAQSASSQLALELRGRVYEEVEDCKPDPRTEENVAYGQVQL